MKLKIIRNAFNESATANALAQLKKMENDVLKGVEYVFDPEGRVP